MKVLVIDNYDSFTYNLVHDLERDFSIEVDVLRNDEIRDVNWMDYQRVVLSPGPGLPNESADLMWALSQLETLNIPVLGICLGLQAMVEHTGGELYNLSQVRHGVPLEVKLNPNESLFKNFSEKTVVGLYHSWAAKAEVLPVDWEIVATSEEGVIMGIRHRLLPWVAVQFHPESVLTSNGKSMLQNWLDA